MWDKLRVKPINRFQNESQTRSVFSYLAGSWRRETWGPEGPGGGAPAWHHTGPRAQPGGPRGCRSAWRPPCTGNSSASMMWGRRRSRAPGPRPGPPSESSYRRRSWRPLGSGRSSPSSKCSLETPTAPWWLLARRSTLDRSTALQ